MARKRHTDEDALKLLREIEVHLGTGHDVSGACREAGGMGRSRLSEMRGLEEENRRLKTSRRDGRAASVAELELDKLILKRCPAGDCLQSQGGRASIF